MKRRQFLQVGVVGAALLAAGGEWLVWHDRHAPALEKQRRIDRVIGAIAPAILASAMPGDPAARREAIARVSRDVGSIVMHFTRPVQQEVHDLFALLDVGVARRALTGVSSDWPEADPVEVAAFLERWRRSSIPDLQAGYHALHDLVFGAWYADPRAWDAIGYAGPPVLSA